MEWLFVLVALLSVFSSIQNAGKKAKQKQEQQERRRRELDARRRQQALRGETDDEVDVDVDERQSRRVNARGETVQRREPSYNARGESVPRREQSLNARGEYVPRREQQTNARGEAVQPRPLSKREQMIEEQRRLAEEFRQRLLSRLGQEQPSQPPSHASGQGRQTQPGGQGRQAQSPRQTPPTRQSRRQPAAKPAAKPAAAPTSALRQSRPALSAVPVAKGSSISLPPIDDQALVNAVIMSEILGPCKARR